LGAAGMQYREFEEVLIQMLGINEAGLGAFRGRLRHLRNLGIPNVPKRGSGNAVSYKKEDLFTTLIALTLQTLGSAPVVSAILARKAAGHIYLLGGVKEVFLIVGNFPDPAPGNIEDIPGIEPGVLGFSWIKNQFGGDTYSCVVLGAAEAGKIVTSTKTIACSVINLSERFKKLPEDA
jgi:hypothetical protein